MARAISTDELDRIPVTDYGTLRPSLESGDLFFASGEYPISRLIREFTNSTFSHCGIIFVVNSISRVLLLESVEEMGVRLVPLSKYLSDYSGNRTIYNGRVVVARSSFIQENPQRAVPILQSGMDKLAHPFSVADRPEPTDAYVCSELVSTCFAQGGCTFTPNPSGSISPDDIWCDSTVQFSARIL